MKQDTIDQLDDLIIDLELLKTNPETTGFLEEDETGIKWFNNTTYKFEQLASSELKALANKINVGLDSLLITSLGQNDIGNRVYLTQRGFKFHKGESDSFGPLTSVINLGEFRICYG